MDGDGDAFHHQAVQLKKRGSPRTSDAALCPRSRRRRASCITDASGAPFERPKAEDPCVSVSVSVMVDRKRERENAR